jgi:hypothetical protein
VNTVLRHKTNRLQQQRKQNLLLYGPSVQVYYKAIGLPPSEEHTAAPTFVGPVNRAYKAYERALFFGLIIIETEIYISPPPFLKYILLIPPRPF